MVDISLSFAHPHPGYSPVNRRASSDASGGKSHLGFMYPDGGMHEYGHAFPGAAHSPASLDSLESKFLSPVSLGFMRIFALCEFDTMI